MVTDCDRSSEKEKMIRITPGMKLLTKSLHKHGLPSLHQNVRSITSGKPQSLMDSGNPQCLPLLPVPKLNATMDLYLESVKPLLKEEDFSTTKNIVEEFVKSGSGCKLHQMLEEKAKRKSNWLAEWWLDTAYLKFRRPVTLFSSPGQVFPKAVFCDICDWLSYCAQVVVAAASYKTLIDNKKIPIDKMGKDPLDMNQYNLIFGTCRIPSIPKDSLQFNPRSQHIIVCYNNHFFKVQIFDNDGKFLNAEQVLRILEDIVKYNEDVAEPIGILSSDCRDSWAKAYLTLIKEKLNERSVKEIQTSLFLLCLDECIPSSDDDTVKSRAGKQLLHGGGSELNSGNRWFDKTLQFVVAKDGLAGITYEHSPSEGQPVANLADYISNFINNCECQKVLENKNIPLHAVQLNFHLNGEIRAAISHAKENVDLLVRNLNLAVLNFTGFGKDFIKSQKLSPDSFIQMAFQYTYYKMYQKPAAQYESGSTRKFLHGRTETIRSCSEESVKFAKAMIDAESDGEKLKALKAAVESHKKYTLRAINGMGVDRYLLGIKLAAIESHSPIPKLFDDLGYKRSTYFDIASSQVATKGDGFMCYGPSVDDGYGCCYNPRDNDINIAISSLRSSTNADAQLFCYTLQQCLCDMQRILTKAKL